MQLLYTRIEIQPGRKPQGATRAGGQGAGGDIGPGSTLLTVANTQPFENAFRIHVECGHPHWQPEWVRLRALPLAPNSDGSAVQQTQRDQYIPQNQSVRLFVPQKQSRDLQILFDLPQNPRSRAGLYALRIVVEEEGRGSGPGANGGARRVRTIPAELLVLPFYRWSLETRPRQARLGWFKRGAPLEVVVRNQGNDWLYCRVNHPDATTDAQALKVAGRFVTHLAVPPPPPDDDTDAKGAERAVLLRVAGGPTLLRGAPVPLPLALTATRLEAPSVPRWRDDETGELHTGAVVTKETTEQSALPPGSGALYYPPIPAQISQAADGAGGFVRGLAGTVAGVLIALHVGVVLFEQTFRSNIDAQVLNNRVKVGNWVTVKGNWLPGSKILVKGNKESEYVPVKAEIGRPSGGGSGKLSREVQYLSFKADSDLDGQTVRVQVRRAGFLPWMSALLPVSNARPPVVIGDQRPDPPVPPTPPTPNPTPTPMPIVSPKVSSSPAPTPIIQPSKPPTPKPSVSADSGPSPTPQPSVTPKIGPTPTPRPLPSIPVVQLPPTYDRLLLRDDSGAISAGDRRPIQQAIQARTLVQGDLNKAVRLARAVRQRARGGAQDAVAYAVAGTVLMDKSVQDAFKSSDAAAGVRAVEGVYRENLRRAPGSVLSYTVAATSLQTLGQHDKAVAVLRQGEKNALTDTKAAPIALAWAWQEIGEIDHARTLLNQALQDSPELALQAKVQELQGALR